MANITINMRAALHGIGLGLIMKKKYLKSDPKDIYFQHFKDPLIIDAFVSTLEKIAPACIELTDLCHKATSEGSIRIGNLHYHGRTTLNSILWPFPRLWVSHSASNNQDELTGKISADQLQKALDHFIVVSQSTAVFEPFLGTSSFGIPQNGPLYLLFLYIHNLRQHAANILKLVEFVEHLEEKRTRNRFWFPHQKLKKWLLSNSEIGAVTGADVTDYSNHAGGNDLARVSTRQDGRRDAVIKDEGDVFQTKRPQDQSRRLGDPDVSAPVTLSQKFFYGLYIFGRWMTSTNTFFAFKTAVGVVMMAIPAYRPGDVSWYISWRGQWAMITLVLWMFPMTGAFLFGCVFQYETEAELLLIISYFQFNR